MKKEKIGNKKMIKKQFIVTMIVDENHKVVRERIACSLSIPRWEKTAEAYIDKEMYCLANKYENVNSVEQGLKDWGEWIEYKETTEDSDSTRDIAISCVDRLVKEGYVKDCTGTNDTTEFSVQDIIHEEINKPINASEEVSELLNEACEIITLLEDISGLSKHGYPDGDYNEKVDTFFDKIKGINENPWNK